MTPDGLRDSTLVLLVLNEIDGLRETFDRLPIAQFARTVAVDGGSTDGSGDGQIGHTSSSGIMRISSSSSGGGVGDGGVGGGCVGGGGDDATSGLSVSRS